MAGTAGIDRRAEMTKVGKATLALVAVAVVASRCRQRWLGSTAGDAHDRVGIRRHRAAWRRSTVRRSRQRSRTSPPSTRRSSTKVKLLTCNTQGNKAAIAKACAREAPRAGRRRDHDDVRRRLAAPVVQESINAGKLTVAACIGTDQMGPKRFGPKGRLAFSYGNVAQDEGSAMAEFAWKKGWRSATSRRTR